MKKKEAFRLAEKFRNEHPELADRALRICNYPTTGFNAYTVIKKIPRGPRGGMKDSVQINSTTNGTMINIVYSGEVIMRVDYNNGWPTYSSAIALPHDECGQYADERWRGKFSTEEKITSVRWAIKNLPADPHTQHHLNETLYNLGRQLEQCAAWKAQQEQWERDYAIAMAA